MRAERTTQPAVATSREWLGLAVLALPTLLVAMDMTSLFLALPRLSAVLRPTSVEQMWITDSYGFMVAGFVITTGTRGDRIGRRRLLMTGGAMFAALSIGAAYAVSPQMLIACRALLGIAGATLMPSTLALISNMFRVDGQRHRAIAVWATCQFTGAALGPVLSGFLLQRFWWGSVFLIAVPAMVVLLVAAPVLLPEYRNPVPGRLDSGSVVLSLGAVLLIVYGLKQVTVAGPQPVTVPVSSIIVGLALAAMFGRRQLRLDTPLLDLHLFRSRPFTAVLVALVLAGTAMAGIGLLVTQYLQSVLGYPPVKSALVFAPMGLGVAIGTMTSPWLARRLKPTTAIGAGLALSVLGALLLSRVDSTSGPVLVVAGIAILAVGTGPLFGLGTALVVGSAPLERAGSAASMSETANYFGSSLGLAVVGVISTSMYRHRMHSVLAAGVPQAARGTLAGAIAVSKHVPADDAAVLLHAGKAAFTSGLNVTGIVTVVIFATLAVSSPSCAPRPLPAMPRLSPSAADREVTPPSSSEGRYYPHMIALSKPSQSDVKKPLSAPTTLRRPPAPTTERKDHEVPADHAPEPRRLELAHR